MAMHTSGPWSYHTEDLRGGRYYCVVIPGADETIDIHQTDNGEANAKLIAASPDLLAALKAVVAIADRRTDEFNAARAAIAKATA